MLSIVIPVYNEQESLAELHREISAVAEQIEHTLEILFVDDGSRDDSWTEIQQLAEKDARVKGLRFRRNFGKAAALNAGFSAAQGTLVITMDADLQDDPAEIPRFLTEMDGGLDVVSGWKKVRHDPWHKVGPSRVFNWLVGKLTGVKLHDHNCGFKCYRREIFDEVHIYGELHRFIPVLASAKGWRVGEVVVNHRRRKYGHSKYGVRRFIKGFLDLLTVYFLTGYGQRPQHLLGTVGLFFFGFGSLGIVLLTAWWGISRLDNLQLWWMASESAEAWAKVRGNDLHLHERAVFYYSIVSLLLGAQFLCLGIVAELLLAHLGRAESSYSISDRIGSDS